MTKNFTRDEHGFLIERHLWNEDVAHLLAKYDGIVLTADHWQVIYWLRDFYQRYQLAPALRILIKGLTEVWGKEKATSIYLHQLFPEGPVKQASKFAGLPRPLKCM